MISLYYDELITLFKEADKAMTQTLNNRNGSHSSSNRKWKHVLAWNDLLRDTYQHYKDAYKTWLETEDDLMFQQMKNEQKKFKYALRKVRKT